MPTCPVKMCAGLINIMNSFAKTLFEQGVVVIPPNESDEYMIELKKLDRHYSLPYRNEYHGDVRHQPQETDVSLMTHNDDSDFREALLKIQGKIMEKVQVVLQRNLVVYGSGQYVRLKSAVDQFTPQHCDAGFFVVNGIEPDAMFRATDPPPVYTYWVPLCDFKGSSWLHFKLGSHKHVNEEYWSGTQYPTHQQRAEYVRLGCTFGAVHVFNSRLLHYATAQPRNAPHRRSIDGRFKFA